MNPHTDLTRHARSPTGRPVKLAVPARGLKAAYVLTVLTIVLLVVVSAGGAFGSGWLYRDNSLITATFRGQDWVTLLVAVPPLGAGLLLELRGSLGGRLLWLGMLFNAMYSYLFYAGRGVQRVLPVVRGHLRPCRLRPRVCCPEDRL